jgi:hypothetical protein
MTDRKGKAMTTRPACFVIAAVIAGVVASRSTATAVAEHGIDVSSSIDGHRHRLVTSWLAPGMHRFTVRAVPAHGSPVSHTATARVLPSPPPPPEQANTRWRHILEDQGELGSRPGTWTLRIDSTGWRIDPPNVDFKDARKGDDNFLDVAYLAPGLVELRGGIWTHPRSRQEGNGWCEDTNQAVRYRWMVTDGQLNLTLDGPKRCGDQATVLSGAEGPRSSGGTWIAVGALR